MNKGEFGQVIRANLNQDISSANSYKMVLQPQEGDSVEKTATLGASNITVGDESWLANEYVEYTVESGILDFTGQWRRKGKATFSNKEIIGNYSRFTVLA